ncbi:MAG: S-methyl-5-thioribose-1-phosphate isomerase [Verrucomicrobiaceae bacterium]|nr:S-methyl-5-thioribose-1-phosphate isomerase [Verrucomicrobiaceae bacterium]
MLVEGTPYRTVWIEADGESVGIIDQRRLPFAFETLTLRTAAEVGVAIRDMLVRGAGCIGAVAAHGMFLAARECHLGGLSGAAFDNRLDALAAELRATRPTAVNLAWAVRCQLDELAPVADPHEKVVVARDLARRIADEDADSCRRIGEHGLSLLRDIFHQKGGKNPVNILTHCNAGWLAFVDHGSATAPIYAAHDAGIPVHVWVDETRPRNQGARLTAWELGQHGVPHTVIVDNAGGHLMQRGLVDLVLTGTDRTTWTGDVANKIGTYLKALAARDNGIPFYVALPSSTFDWETADGVADIPIEERSGTEVARISGLAAEAEAGGGFPGEVEVNLVAKGSPVANYAFDVTPARLVTGLISERGICAASAPGIAELFPEISPSRESAN